MRQPRLAGYALHNIPPGSDIPWHRVLNARGKISLSGAAGKKQRELLENEGVVFHHDRVNLGRHGWPRQKGIVTRVNSGTIHPRRSRTRR
jgi:methylated-DNA-protein-cysteine methyltransferase-like protein